MACPPPLSCNDADVATGLYPTRANWDSKNEVTIMRGYLRRMETRCEPSGNSPSSRNATVLQIIMLCIDPINYLLFVHKCVFSGSTTGRTGCLLCHCKTIQNSKIRTKCTYLWLSCEPRRLDIVSSKFWRRSRTFCTVRFLWDSGSVVQPCRTRGHKTFSVSK